VILARETIYAAFWAKALTAKDRTTGWLPFKTYDRRLQHWNNVPAGNQPAMFMVEHQQVVHQTKGLPPTWNFHLSLFVYDNCGGSSKAIPGQRINNLLDAIDDAFAPVIGYQTLGGLVSHCWISGPIEIYEGYEGMMDQSVAIIPFEIRVPDDSGPV